MCISPQTIDNKNYRNPTRISRLSKNTTTTKIAVPCGHCPECLFVRQQDFLQRVIMASEFSYVYFCTLTYKDEVLPKYTYYDKKGREHVQPFADITDFQNLIKRLRRRGMLPVEDRSKPWLGAKFLCCTEFGGQTHRPHFHFLLFIPKCSRFVAPAFYFEGNGQLGPRQLNAFAFTGDEINAYNYAEYLYFAVLQEWRENIALCQNKKGKVVKNTRAPEYRALCEYHQRGKFRNYDFHYVRPYTQIDGVQKTISDVSAYVSKYILKFDPFVLKLKQRLYASLVTKRYNNEEDITQFKYAWSAVKPHCLVSKNLGCSPESVDNLREFALSHLEHFGKLCFSDPYGLKVTTLSQFYRKKLYISEDLKKKPVIPPDAILREIMIFREMTGQTDLDKPTEFYLVERDLVALRDEYYKKQHRGIKVNRHLVNINKDPLIYLENG